MDITLLVIGKTNSKYLVEGIEEYCRRLKYYVSFNIHYLPDIKNTKKMSEQQQKDAEGMQFLSVVNNSDYVVLLDERGKEITSMQYSEYLQKKMLSGLRRLVFVVGGPYGFSNAIYERANDKISFSKMTFSHEMIRLFFVEQLYRGFTILNGEPYHHQ